MPLIFNLTPFLLLSSLLAWFASYTFAAPISSPAPQSTRTNTSTWSISIIDPLAALLNNTFGFIPASLIPHPTRSGPPALPTTATPYGLVRGFADANANRFTLPFARPPLGQLRFANPQPVTPWNSTLDASVLPNACPQYYDSSRGGNQSSEDCLYLNIYQPLDATAASALPVMVWIHGGSFIEGSSTAAGLDGSTLAHSQNVIVVTIQYRLGVFGFFQTASTLDEAAGGSPGSEKVAGNQAVRDVMMALAFLHVVAPSFGADPSSVTLFGQSSGAHMIRALLGTPSASPLFSRAILQSDPMNYALSSAQVADSLGDQTLSSLNCSSLSCLRGANMSDLLQAEYALASSAPAANPAISGGEPWRPVYGSLVTAELQDNPGAAKGKSLVITTVVNEAGPTVASVTNNNPIPASAFDSYAASFIGVQRVSGNSTSLDSVIQSYAPPANSSDPDLPTERLEDIGTDGEWRCAAQMLARDIAASGGTVYLGEFMEGVQYPSNAGWGYCNVAGRVCHEDDIYLTFGTYPATATAAQHALSAEVQARWATFARSGNPNPPFSPSSAAYAHWQPVVSGTQLDLLLLGTGGGGTQMEIVNATQRPSFCGPGAMWGYGVPFDWQLYPASG